MRPLFVRPSSERCHCRCCATILSVAATYSFLHSYIIHSMAATYIESLLRHHWNFQRSDKEVDFSLVLVSKSLELLSTHSKNLLYRLSSCNPAKIEILLWSACKMIFWHLTTGWELGSSICWFDQTLVCQKKYPAAVTKMSDCWRGVEPVLLELIR